METPQEDKLTSCQLTVQGFLHGLRKPVTAPCQLVDAAEAAELQTLDSTGLEDLPFVDSGPGLLDPPESISNDSDSEQVPNPSPGAKRPPSPKGVDETFLVEIPKVTRTYTKKVRPVWPQHNVNPAPSLTRPSTHDEALLDGLLRERSASPAKRLASQETFKTKTPKKQSSVLPLKHKRWSLQEEAEVRQKEYSERDEDIVIKKKKKKKGTKRKKRRVTVNELALVTLIESPHFREDSPVSCQDYNSDKVIDLLNGQLVGQSFPASSSPSLERSRKPVTRIRREIIIPCRDDLARENFKFPPITPKTARLPGWRLGSGFEGTPLEQSANTLPETWGNQKIRPARTPYLSARAFPKLELSTRLSLTRKSVGPRGFLKKLKGRGISVETIRYKPIREFGPTDVAAEDGILHSAGETGGKAAFEPMNSLKTLLRPPIENDQSQRACSSLRSGNVKALIQLHQSQNKDLDASQAVRGSLKPNRNGWLKRRRVDFAVSDEDEEKQLFTHARRTCVNGSDNRSQNERDGSDTYLEATAQAQHTIHNDFQSSGQTTPNPERPTTSQQQVDVRDEQSAEQERRRVSHDAEDQTLVSQEQNLYHQRSDLPPNPPPSSDPEANFSSSPSYARRFSIPKPRHQIQVPRTSEVPETQERLRDSTEPDHTRTESLDLGRHPCHITKTTLESGRYFSKAVQQLGSREKLPHTITRRRSRREPDQDVRGSQAMSEIQKGARHVNVAPMTGEVRPEKQEGSLECGVTPRLKRTMSKVSFRPPFKETLL